MPKKLWEASLSQKKTLYFLVLNNLFQKRLNKNLKEITKKF